MSKSVTREDLTLFEKELGRAFPQFRRAKGVPLAGGCRLYGWEPGSDLSFYILMNVARGKRFYLDLAWSRNGRFPPKPIPSIPRDIPSRGWRRTEPEDGDYQFRMPYLWLDHDQAWDVEPPIPSDALVTLPTEEFVELLNKTYPLEELLAKVPRLVDDAIEKFKKYGLPYFMGVARELGIAVEDPGVQDSGRSTREA